MAGKQAGRSAQERAARTREKIQRLEKSAAAWEAGVVGERATGGVLAGLDPGQWSVIHDVRWPGRERANIDHVAVGPGGVFVIDSKNWSGKVVVKDGVLRQNGYSREKAVAGVAESAIAVLEIVPDTPVQPVICLVGDDPFEGWVRDVILCSTANLHTMLTTRPATLTAEDVRRVTAALEAGLSIADVAPRSTSVRHGRASARRQSTSRSGSSGWRLLAWIVIVALLIGAFQTGLVTKVSEVFADFVVGITLDDSSEQEPVKKPRREQRQGERQQDAGQ